jgi:hypothetical protein
VPRAEESRSTNCGGGSISVLLVLGVHVNNCCHSVMIAEWRSKENPLTCVVIGKPKKLKRETVRGTKPRSSM